MTDLEIEVKFFPVDHDLMRKTLTCVGATREHEMRLMRRAVYGSESNPGMGCTYVRVRDEGHEVTMSAKWSPQDGVITSQREIVTTVADYDAAVAILTTCGLTQTDYQESKRETWVMPDGVLVELEEWPHLPPYMEIEGPSVDAIHATATALGLHWGDRIVGPVNVLYEAGGTAADLRDLRFTSPCPQEGPRP